MESSWIPDADIQASSFLDEDHAPHFARLHGHSSWIPHPSDRNPAIQVSMHMSHITLFYQLPGFIVSFFLLTSICTQAAFTLQKKKKKKIEYIRLFSHSGVWPVVAWPANTTKSKSKISTPGVFFFKSPRFRANACRHR